MLKYILSLALLLPFSLTAEALKKGQIANIEGIIISEQDVIEAIQQIPEMERRTLGDDKVKESVIQNIVNDTVVLQAATKAGVQQKANYKKLIQEESDRLARQIFVEEAIQPKISDKALKAAYEKEYSKSYKTIKARHILLKTESEAKAVIETLNQQDKETDLEKKFAELAKEKSTGPSGANGGDLGWFDEKAMVPAFGKAAFALDKASYTKQPVKTRFGYHVIYVSDQKTAAPPSFEAVKDQLRQKIAQEEIFALLKDLQGNADVEIDTEALSKLKVPSL